MTKFLIANNGSKQQTATERQSDLLLCFGSAAAAAVCGVLLCSDLQRLI